MIKGKKQIKDLAKKLFLASFDGKNLDEYKINNIVEAVKNSYKSSAYSILKAYLSYIRHFQRENILLVESTESVDQSYLDSIRGHFETQTGRKLSVESHRNNDLLGGVRVTLGDNQYDLSVKGRIDQMKEVLSEQNY